MYKNAEKYRKVLANSTKEVYNISIRQKNSEICEVESMIKAGIIGATGYAGAELVRLLLGHKEVEIKWYGSRSYVDQAYASVYQNMFQLVDEKCLDLSFPGTPDFKPNDPAEKICTLVLVKLCGRIFLWNFY